MAKTANPQPRPKATAKPDKSTGSKPDKSTGSIVVFNCTASAITALSVNGNNVPIGPNGIKAINPNSASVFSDSVSRDGLGASTSVSVGFDGQSGWSATLYIPQPGSQSIYLWCFLSGFNMTDQFGTVFQYYVQSAPNGQ